jgi:glycosyltransferase involved in cell wall biosynthesis
MGACFMKRVLFIISSLTEGGAQRAVSNIVTHLPDDWEIDILLNTSSRITYPYRGNIIDLHLAIPQNRNGLVYQSRMFFRRYKVLRKIKKNNNYAACISFSESANIVNVITGRKYCRVLLSVRINISNDSTLKKRLLVNAMIRLLYKKADRVIPNSKGIRNDLINNFGLKPTLVQTICNGFAIDEIKKCISHPSKAASFTFITTARIYHQKGQWHLIRAFNELINKQLDCRLIIVGDGPYREYIEKLIYDYHLEQNVVLKGFLDNPFQEMAAADVFVFPSLFEGFSNAMLEALVCELPIISSDHRSGAREILAPDTDIEYEQKTEIEFAQYGIIVPVCSGNRYNATDPLEPQEILLAEAMEKLYLDRSIVAKYSEVALLRAKDFSIEKAVAEWVWAISD